MKSLPLSRALVLVTCLPWLGCADSESDLPVHEPLHEIVRQAVTTPPVAPATLPAARDTAILLNSANTNFGVAKTLDVNRTLVGFDQSALRAAVGPTDYVVSARLELTLAANKLRRNEPIRPVSAHRLTTGWTELGATWNCAIDAKPTNKVADCTGSNRWSMGSPPHPFVSTPSGGTIISPAQTGVITIDLTDDVRSFLGGTANHGWMIKSGWVGELAQFISREGASAPRLVLSIQRCSAALCDDGNACTTDSCSATGQCLNDTAPDGTTCSDGDTCTAPDQCQAGSCRPGAFVCTPPPVVINEIESNGGTPGDWVELKNLGTTAADLSGWVFKDNDDTHGYVLPAGSSIAPGGYLLIEEAALGFGLGSGDSARLFDARGTLVDTHTWLTHAATTYGRCPDGSGAFAVTASSTKGASNACSSPQPDAGVDAGPSPDAGSAPILVAINEVESNGGSPGDWVELYNKGSTAVDLSGFVFKDNDDTHAYVLPAGSSIPAGGYFMIEEAAQGFGLGAADSARLFEPGGTRLVDSHAWTTHAAVTYSRCPNGTGSFVATTVSTKAAANDCGGGGGVDAGADGGPPDAPALDPWPGPATVANGDQAGAFGSNLSGLTYQPATPGAPAILWAGLNSPSRLFRLEWNGSVWAKVLTDDWGSGKILVYPSGSGGPDTEGVTKAELDSPFIYVGSERDNTVSGVSRPGVLRYDSSAAGATLVATHEWNLSADLPGLGANLGVETVTWVPDSHLVARSFFDEHRNEPYDPSIYPDHGSGLFFVGVEQNGNVYAYALNHSDSTYQRVATFSSGHPGVMGMEFDRDHGTLWTWCDDTCGNRAAVLSIDATPGPLFGRFNLRRRYARPAGLPNVNNEGIAFTPASECTGGVRSFFWTDDSATGGHSLRQGAIVCGPIP